MSLADDEYTSPLKLPRLFDEDAGQRCWQQLVDYVEGRQSSGHSQPEALGAMEGHKALIMAIASGSPFLARDCVRNPEWTLRVIGQEPTVVLTELTQELTAQINEQSVPLMAALRLAKSRASVAAALNDIAGHWPVMVTTRFLSQFADFALEQSLQYAAVSAGLPINHNSNSIKGLTILGMGKLGAHELNYSSDIDIIALYDADHLEIDDRDEAKKISIKVIRTLIALMNDQTKDGYVFRTDLRLRPDPGVSAVAISVLAAENYYESHGQTWERLAFIKARPVAGDIELGSKFLKSLRPFIWRRYLDYAAIEDINGIRGKIAAAHHQDAIDSRGYNLKLGQGGIREIEFFVQTHQLLFGGKNPDLRSSQTLTALGALAQERILDPALSQSLMVSYQILRELEHRVQMINDEQTHTIPDHNDGFTRLQAFCGFDQEEAFFTVLRNAVRPVQEAYLTLDRDDPDSGVMANLDFTGTQATPETLEALSVLGFVRTEEVDRLVRGWLRGEYRATRAPRSRELIVKVLPALLNAVSEAPDPDEAFLGFDRFIAMLPSSVQVFSLFQNNPEIFETLLTLITKAPRLSRELSRHTGFIEALVDGGWISDQADGDQILNELDQLLETLEGKDFEDVIQRASRYVGEARFLVGANLIRGHTDVETSATSFTKVAERAIDALIPQAMAEMGRNHGDIDGGLCVVGFGRLGARRMTFASDVDLVFVYDTPPASQSRGISNGMGDGERSIDGVTWFTRAVRRSVTALSMGADEGGLYPVDMQLRPSGGAGPAAVSLSAFQSYYAKDAWIWEMMALTKARVISGPEEIRIQINECIQEALTRERKADTVAQAILDMRRRLLRDKPASSLWDRKRIRGGQTDIDFIVQYLTLCTASHLGLPPLETPAALKFFAAHQLLTEEQTTNLLTADQTNETLTQFLRLSLRGPDFVISHPSAVATMISQRCKASSLGALEDMLKDQQAKIMAIFGDVVG